MVVGMVFVMVMLWYVLVRVSWVFVYGLSW